jgi:hypothetical protein
MTEHTREVHQYVVYIAPTEGAPLQHVDLRSYDRDELLALRRRLVSSDTSPTSWVREIAAIDYLTDGHYTRDQEMDAEKAAEAPALPDPAVVPTSEVMAMQQELDLRTAERDALNARAAQLTLDVDRLYRELCESREVAGRDLTRFKQRVVEVATRYAKDNDWCSVIDNALDELGLERPRVKYRARATITVEFTAELADRSANLPGRGWVESSMNMTAIEDAITDALDNDEDHEAETNVRDISITVSSVEAVDG